MEPMAMENSKKSKSEEEIRKLNQELEKRVGP
jgi:hypothetical protein